MRAATKSKDAPARAAEPSALGADRVVAIVLNWNGERDTAACVESLLAQEGVTVDILVVDNGSPDRSGERLRARYPMVQHLQTGENLGYAGGNNRGMEWALARDAQWLLVLNNDTVADPDCVRRLVEAARSDDRLGAVGPLIVRHDDPSRVWAAGGRLDFVRALGVHGREGAAASRVAAMPGRAWQECTFLTGCCLLLRPAAVREVGAFEERYFAYGEDAELSVRMARAGWRQGWVPAARLAHRVPAPGTPPRPDQIRLRDRNRRRLVRTHYTLPWRAAFALWFWPTRLVHLVRYALKGDRARARAIAAGMRES